MNEQENIALVKKLYEAFARGDLKVILDHVSEDVKWSSPGPSSIPYSGDRTGPAQVGEFFKQLASTQQNARLTVEQLIAQGENVAMLGRYTTSIQATGEQLDSVVGHFFTIRAGKVTRWIGLGDTAQAHAAYGRASAAGR